MSKDRSRAFQPVFLEPRDDYWVLHRPEDLSVEDQQSYHLVPLATAEQLSSGVYCEDCFPREADGSKH